jgi:hypothetical protein
LWHRLKARNDKLACKPYVEQDGLSFLSISNATLASHEFVPCSIQLGLSLRQAFAHSLMLSRIADFSIMLFVIVNKSRCHVTYSPRRPIHHELIDNEVIRILLPNALPRKRIHLENHLYGGESRLSCIFDRRSIFSGGHRTRGSPAQTEHRLEPIPARALSTPDL